MMSPGPDQANVGVGLPIYENQVPIHTATGKEDPEEFLSLLTDCKEGIEISDSELLHALPSVLKGVASNWYRVVKREIKTWGHFKKYFRREFLETVDDEDVYDELKSRTQAKEEKISEYLLNLRSITQHFRNPMTDFEMLRIAYRGLTPEYRCYVSSYSVNTVLDLEKHLREYERIKEIDKRYVSPPSKE
ncbi:activity-regulated cytoskeleton associated protein 2-like [Leptopilina heterotoma]|uniref:activity-regulated cytoskeleton associated protein 2-like n=1 Tax=Leptopilina heterotoma TaxID=63436 RepID=UPI001CA815DE|nr:activity-regulated cytoskeleton associated protein 2-like [Leptopilina heterotoma]